MDVEKSIWLCFGNHDGDNCDEDVGDDHDDREEYGENHVGGSDCEDEYDGNGDDGGGNDDEDAEDDDVLMMH